MVLHLVALSVLAGAFVLVDAHGSSGLRGNGEPFAVTSRGDPKEGIWAKDYPKVTKTSFEGKRGPGKRSLLRDPENCSLVYYLSVFVGRILLFKFSDPPLGEAETRFFRQATIRTPSCLGTIVQTMHLFFGMVCLACLSVLCVCDCYVYDVVSPNDALVSLGFARRPCFVQTHDSTDAGRWD